MPDPATAIRDFVEPGDRVLLGTGAGTAQTLHTALVADVDRLDRLALAGGLQLGGYDFIAPVRDARWSFGTWHVMPPIRDDVAAGVVRFHPLRGGGLVRYIERWRPDVFLTVVSPPDAAGFVSFGASVSYALPAAYLAPRVIAEINPGMPTTRGASTMHLSRFAALVEAEHPLPEYQPRSPDERDRSIAAHVHGLLQDGATVQIGIGAVPEALVELLIDDRPSDLRLFGMGIDPMMPVLDKIGTPGAFVGGEILGSTDLYRYAHDNVLVEQYSNDQILNVVRLAAIPRFTSVNGALQIDLSGQVNSEWAGRQISGAGGAFDFVDAANLSEGGISVIAMRSLTPRGDSAIVPQLAAGVPVTIPRHSVQFVVTEHGVADLRGASTAQRRAALIAVADPAHHDALDRSP